MTAKPSLHTMSVSSLRALPVRPGATVEQVQAATGFELLLPEGEVPVTRPPTQAQVRMIRENIDPDNMRKREFRQRATTENVKVTQKMLLSSCYSEPSRENSPPPNPEQER